MNKQAFIQGISLGFCIASVVSVTIDFANDRYKSRHPKIDIDTAHASLTYCTVLQTRNYPPYFTNKNDIDNFYEYCRREHGLARP